MQQNVTLFSRLFTDAIIIAAAMVALRSSLAAFLLMRNVQSGRLLITNC